ncbi:hypothetical protein GCM10020216_032390 [Nonomuraea helvata]
MAVDGAELAAAGRNPAAGDASVRVGGRTPDYDAGGVALLEQIAVPARDGIRTHEEPQPAQDLAW